MSTARWTNAPGGPGRQRPQGGGDDGVGRVLGHGLDHRPGDGRGVEAGRVPAHERRQPCPGPVQVARRRGRRPPTWPRRAGRGRRWPGTRPRPATAARRPRRPPRPRPRRRARPPGPGGRRRSAAPAPRPRTRTRPPDATGRARAARRPAGPPPARRRRRAPAGTTAASPPGGRHQQAHGLGQDPGGAEDVAGVAAQSPDAERDHGRRRPPPRRRRSRPRPAPRGRRPPRPGRGPA